VTFRVRTGGPAGTDVEVVTAADVAGAVVLANPPLEPPPSQPCTAAARPMPVRLATSHRLPLTITPLRDPL
jgi:hypothetical protein